MELNTEINRVFGEEMAKVFSKSISQEEIMNAAKEAWKQLNYRESSYWNGGVKDSQIDKLIKSVCLERLKEELEKITSTDEFKAQMAVLAKQIVDEIIEETHKKTVDEVSNRLAVLSTGYGGYTLKDMIAQTVMDMMNR